MLHESFASWKEVRPILMNVAVTDIEYYIQLVDS